MKVHATSTRIRLSLLTVLALTASPVLAGCFELDDAPNMSGAEYDDVAHAMGALFADEGRGQFPAIRGAVSVAGYELGGEVVHADSMGVAYDLAAVCSDELGRSARCDEAAVAHIEATWSGAWQTDYIDADVSFDGDWILEDLDSDTINLSGRARGSADVIVTRDGAERGWDITFQASYTDVDVAASTGYVASGSAHYDLVISRQATDHPSQLERSFEVDCELQFKADGSVLLVLDSDQVYRAYEDGSVARVEF